MKITTQNAPSGWSSLTAGLARRWRRTRSKPSLFPVEGVIFIVLMILIGLAAGNTGTNLLYLIFALMAAFLIISGYLCHKTIRKIQIERSLPKHIVAGRPIDIRLTVRNRKHVFGSYGLQLSDRIDEDTVAGESYFLRIPPRGEASVAYSCVFNRRGLYRFTHFIVSSSYPFGFVRRSSVVPLEREVLVYPQILPWNELGIQAPSDFGERESGRRGSGTNLFGIREQHPSEGARWVHWKKTAQLDRLMRREFEAEEKRDVTLVLDNRLSKGDDVRYSEAFEQAVVMTASVAHHLLRADHQVELVTRSGRVPLSSGPHQRHRILRALALIEPLAAEGKRPLRYAGRGDTAVMVFHCNGDTTAARFPRGSHVCTVLPPEDEAAARPEIVRRGAREAAK